MATSEYRSTARSYQSIGVVKCGELGHLIHHAEHVQDAQHRGQVFQGLLHVPGMDVVLFAEQISVRVQDLERRQTQRVLATTPS